MALRGILPIDRATLGSEVLAGVTLAALAIPEVMGYTRIAGMPVVTGLYTLLLPALLFAFLGSSRHLVVGADSATAAIMAATLAPFAVLAGAGRSYSDKDHGWHLALADRLVAANPELRPPVVDTSPTAAD